ncbi:MAG: adhesin [Candidatus Sedimenticola sp. (ex Thyasira tokunagai)]
MLLNENIEVHPIPLYQVKELTMEEALLVLAAEKERAVYDAQAAVGSERVNFPG